MALSFGLGLWRPWQNAKWQPMNETEANMPFEVKWVFCTACVLQSRQCPPYTLQAELQQVQAGPIADMEGCGQ